MANQGENEDEERRDPYAYWNALGHHRILTREQEVELFTQLASYAGAFIRVNPKTRECHVEGCEQAKACSKKKPIYEVRYNSDEKPFTVPKCCRAKFAKQYVRFMKFGMPIVNRLLRVNVRLVQSIAYPAYKAHKRKHRRTAIQQIDLLQEGLLGLTIAIVRFETSYKVRLFASAKHWIRQAINRYLENRGETIRTPSWYHERQAIIARATGKLFATKGRVPTISELVDETGLTEAKIQFWIDNRIVSQTSLDEPAGEENDSSRMDFVADDDIIWQPELGTEAVEQLHEAQELLENLRACIDELRENQHAAITRYDLGNETLAQIAADRHVTPPAVRSSRLSALRVLRRQLIAA